MYKFDYETKIWGDTSVSLSPFCLTAPKLKFALESLKNIKKGGKILEVGCGAGGIVKALKKYRPDLNFYAIDISKTQISIAKKGSNSIKFSLGSAYKIPFLKNYFDAVLMFDVLEHLDKPLNALKEIDRVLKPKGLFSLFTPIEGNPLSIHGLIYNVFKFNPKEKYGGHVQNFTFGSVVKLSQKAKLKFINNSYYGHLFNQIVDYSYFLILSIRGTNVSGSIESIINRKKGVKINLLRIVKNIISLVSYLESKLLFFFPASGVNILFVSEK